MGLVTNKGNDMDCFNEKLIIAILVVVLTLNLFADVRGSRITEQLNRIEATLEAFTQDPMEVEDNG